MRLIPQYWPKERVPQMIFLDDGKTDQGSDAEEPDVRVAES